MAVELTTTQLHPESHLLLDQPLLRLPEVLLRRNFKTAQSQHQKKCGVISSKLKETANNAFKGTDAEKTLQDLDGMIAVLHDWRRKMGNLHQQEQALHKATRHRLEHLQDVYGMNSLVDVKYDEWSRTRLDRYLVEYLVRQGYAESARALAKEKNVVDLVDLEVFDRYERIVAALRRGSTKECLSWIIEQKELLKKMNTQLEFELRLQQYIELCRESRPVEARKHAREYFTKHISTQGEKILWAAGMLACPPEGHHRYGWWYSQERREELVALFTDTHHQLFSITSYPLLLVALSAGLSAVKTPSCHSKHASSTANASSTTTSVCPICSTELNELARKLPYAHHTKSYVETDPVVLPNGRVYGRDRLLKYCKKLGLDEGMIKDPTTSEMFRTGEMRKVFIT